MPPVERLAQYTCMSKHVPLCRADGPQVWPLVEELDMGVQDGICLFVFETFAAAAHCLATYGNRIAEAEHIMRLVKADKFRMHLEARAVPMLDQMCKAAHMKRTPLCAPPLPGQPIPR